VLFLLFGASGSGKTAALEVVRGRVPGLACHDFDEIGVPSDADRLWRQVANEAWLGRVVAAQSQGLDVLLAGQTPFGELLATPSADGVGQIVGLLLDCSDAIRRERLAERAIGSLDDMSSWAAWMRGHAADPRWQPEVIREGAWEEMRWGRWSGWQRGDPRWNVRVVDTSELAIGEVAGELVRWIEAERPSLGV
jgi:hypothetical protein